MRCRYIPSRMLGIIRRVGSERDVERDAADSGKHEREVEAHSSETLHPTAIPWPCGS